MSTSNLYKNTGRITFASKLSLHIRNKMFSKFMQVMSPRSDHVVLDVGVTSDDQYPESNYFEKMYPYKDKIVCVGTEDGSHLEEKYPGVKFTSVRSGESLPFKDATFDIVFSNAVIEHVGSDENQIQFINEIVRVSKRFFVTTPNRWVPVEFHTAIPLLHWLPKKLHRGILTAFGEKFWSKEENLNLLGESDFRRLFPEDCDVTVDYVSMFGYPTNLIAYRSVENAKLGMGGITNHG